MSKKKSQQSSSSTSSVSQRKGESNTSVVSSPTSIQDEIENTIPNKSLRVAFLHPDLGIGGAERLVVDAALALKSKGHQVVIYTSRHDPKRSFKETHNGELTVKVAGSYFPRHILWRFMVICAIIRNLLCALSLLFARPQYDIIFIDQISASIPLFKLFSKSKVLFYCHFPDKLLTSRQSIIKRLYRVPVDWFEEFTTSMADRIVVNSNFTRSIFQQSFRTIRTVPDVVYPSLNLKQFDETVPSNKGLSMVPENKKLILSINRYERKKNLMLALEAFKLLQDKYKVKSDRESFNQFQLVLAGGYDPGLKENVDHLQELKTRTAELGLTNSVSFVCSFNEEQRAWLLKHSICLVYTPSNEHFGITPLEGMYMSLPVIAVNSGGPLETVKHESTGYLCNPSPQEFAKAYYKVVNASSNKMGEEGRRWVSTKFSFNSFANSLHQIIVSM